MAKEREAMVSVPTHIAAVCGTSERYALGSVLLCESGVAMATDGSCLAAVAVDVTGEVGQDCNENLGLQQRKGWQLIPGNLIRKPTVNVPTKLMLNGRVECLNTSKVGEYIEAKYPRIGDCLHVLDLDRYCLKLDAKRLKNLADALCKPGESGVTLMLDPKEMSGTIYVKPIDASGIDATDNIGVLMPLSKRDGVTGSSVDEITSYNNSRDRMVADLPAEMKKAQE